MWQTLLTMAEMDEETARGRLAVLQQLLDADTPDIMAKDEFDIAQHKIVGVYEDITMLFMNAATIRQILHLAEREGDE